MSLVHQDVTVGRLDDAQMGPCTPRSDNRARSPAAKGWCSAREDHKSPL
jgi:hypothetical protein